jgi:outer membrane autotransporter protein
MRRRGILAGAMLALVVAPAAAQQAGGPTADCSNFGASRDGKPSIAYVLGCDAALLDRQSLINNSTTLSDVVGRRLQAGPDSVAPASLNLSPDEAASWMRRGPISISPTADVPVASSSPLWNFWVEGKGSALDNGSALSNMDGELWNGTVGADYKVGDKLVIGAVGTYESSNLDGSGLLPPSQDTEGWGGGLYMGLNVTDNIVFSANVLGSTIDTRIDAGGVTNFDSDRLQTSAGLTGYYYSGTWRFSPELTLAYSKEWQKDKAGIVNDQTIETGILTPGLQIGDSVSIGGSSTVEPWLGAQVDWTFLNKTRDSGLGTIVNDPNVDLRFQAGLNFAFGGNAQLSLMGEASGILLEKQDTFTGSANFAFQF